MRLTNEQIAIMVLDAIRRHNRKPKKNGTITLGNFEHEEDAAKAYDFAAVFLEPQDKDLNFPEIDYMAVFRKLPRRHFRELLPVHVN
jgi:hypothetical protein